MRRSAIVAAASKELRALWPLWLASMFVVAASVLWTAPTIRRLSLFAYVAGSIALGAHAFGHDYTYRTLGLLLSHPIDRRRLLLVRLGLLAALLAPLGVAAAWTLFEDGELRSPSASQTLWLTGLCALFLTPTLTMLSRSSLAGAVFTVTIPGLVLLAAELTGIARFGTASAAAVDAFRGAVFLPAMLGICAVAAVASWRLFVQLEAVDVRGRDIHLPQWITGPVASPQVTRRHPIRCLVAKELHIHQMAVLMAALYAVGMIAAIALRRSVPEMSIDAAIPVTMVYIGVVPVLIGSLASAEERQFGTLHWQLLMPMPSWQQWSVKVLVTLALALLLAVALPMLLALSSPTPGQVLDMLPQLVLLTVALTIGSLYVSSLSASGLRALIAAFPVLFGVFLFVLILGQAVPGELQRLDALPIPRRRQFPWPIVLLLTALISSVVLILAAHNHRIEERSVRRVVAQAALLATLLSAGVLAVALLGF